MWDVIIVGARCAGSSLAMLLGRRGHNVLVLDRAAFPSDTMSSHIIHPAGGASLKRWGLLEKVRATGVPVTVEAAIDFGPVVLTGTPPAKDGVAEWHCVRRNLLDAILVEAARDAGAEVRERFSVDELIQEDGAVVGIRGRDASGRHVSERASIVVGADGVHSRVANGVQPEEYHVQPVMTCCYYTYYEDLPCERVEICMRPGSAFGFAPTNDNLTMAIAFWPVERFHEVRTNIEPLFLERFVEAPGLAARIGSAKRAERFIGTADLPNFLRKPYGPGWALVGDAGYHKDPIGAQGITDAFRDAELLADAIAAGLEGTAEIGAALGAYEEQRNEAALPIYEVNCDLASLQPPAPEMQALVGALAGNQEQAERFIGTLSGTVPVPEFFDPGNIERIIGAAATT